MNYRAFIKILRAHNFEQVRQRGRHRIFEGFVGGRRRCVTVAYKTLGEHILPKNKAAMIRQSGLPKKTFR